MTVTFHVPGPPTGKARARFNTKTGRAFTPTKTVNAESHIALCWQQTGADRLENGPVFLQIVAVLDRPRSHYTKAGDLNAAGRANWWCLRKPDLDNIVKLVADSLNGVAYRDDAQIVVIDAHRRWAQDGEQAGLTITVAPATTEAVPAVQGLREAA